MSDNWLQEWAGQTVASEMHGMLSGFVLSYPSEDDGARVARMLDVFDGGEEVDNEDRVRLAQVSMNIASLLQTHDLSFEFELTLPDDEESLVRRVAGLSTWAQGFLFALGAAGSDAPWLDQESTEILVDLQKISQASGDFSTAEDDEEADYLELVEYARVAVMLLATRVAQSLQENTQ